MASTLQNTYSKSFPGSNLLELSLVKDIAPDLPFYKPRYFCFVSVTPGMKTDTGGRTFSKDGRITIKADLEKVMALANSIRAFARGQGQTFGQFAIFADSSKSGFQAQQGQSNIKTCFVSEYKQDNPNGGTKTNVVVSLKAGQKPIGNFMSPCEAMAMADIFEFIAKKGLELDFEARVNSNMGAVQNTNQFNSPQPQQNYNSQPQQNNGQFNPQAGSYPYPQQNSSPQSAPQQSPNTPANVNAAFGNAMNNMSNNGAGPQPIDDDMPF